MNQSLKKIFYSLIVLLIFSCEETNRDYSPYFNMTDEVRQLHTPLIKNGLLYNRDGSLYNGSGKYVIIQKDKLVIKRANYLDGSNKDSELRFDYDDHKILKGFVDPILIKKYDSYSKVGRVVHTNLAKPHTPISSGWIRVEKGVVVCIDRRSGHYKPRTSSFRRGLTILKEQLKIDLSKAEVKFEFSNYCRNYRLKHNIQKNWLYDSYNHKKWNCVKGIVNQDLPVSLTNSDGQFYNSPPMAAGSLIAQKNRVVINNSLVFVDEKEANGTFNFLFDRRGCMGLYKRGEQKPLLKNIVSEGRIELQNGKITCLNKSKETKDQSFLRIIDLFEQFEVQIPKIGNGLFSCS